MVGLDFPFEPSQLGLTTFSVGLPAFMLTIFARPEERHEPLLSSLVRFVLPFAVWTMLLGVMLYSYLNVQGSERFADLDIPPRAIRMFEEATGLTYGVDADFAQVAVTLVAQSVLSTFVSIATILLVLFLHPPHPFFTGWRPLSPDRRPALTAIALAVIFIGLLSLPPVLNYFGVVGAPPGMWGILGILLLVWLLGFRLILRQRWVDRLMMPT